MDDDYIINPLTQRRVLKKGITGQKVLRDLEIIKELVKKEAEISKNLEKLVINDNIYQELPEEFKGTSYGIYYSNREEFNNLKNNPQYILNKIKIDKILNEENDTYKYPTIKLTDIQQEQFDLLDLKNRMITLEEYQKIIALNPIEVSLNETKVSLNETKVSINECKPSIKKRQRIIEEPLDSEVIYNQELIRSMTSYQNFLYCGSEDGYIIVINRVSDVINNDKLVKTNSGISHIKKWKAHEDWITSLLIITNVLISGSRDSFIKIWSIKTSNLIQTLSLDLGCLSVISNKIPDQFITSSYKSIKVWEYNGFSDNASLIKDIEPFIKDSNIECLTLFKEGLLIENSLLVCGYQNGYISNNYQKIQAHSLAVITIGSNDQYLISGSYDKKIKVFNKSLENIKTFDGMFHLVLNNLLIFSKKNEIFSLNLSDYDVISHNYDVISHNYDEESKIISSKHKGFILNIIKLSNNLLVSSSWDSTIRYLKIF